MSWHDRSCGIPDLSWAGGYPTCIRCGSSASCIANGSVVTPPPPAPPPCLKRSQLVCSWPPCVEYSDSYIDENGNDVTAFITENIDAWNIDRFEVPDDQANFQEVRETSQQTEGSSVLPMACSDTMKAYASEGVVQTTHDKIHTVASSPPLTYRSDRIYEYLSGSDDFRLLKLYGSASFDDPIHCTLEIAQLDDPDVPLYEALSYTWADLDGDKRNCMSIYIGCHFDLLLVTKNCESALRRLRKRTSRLLWIDAICINQNDPVDRSTQVNHMAKIYSKASRVRIYLGETSNGSEEAFGMATAYAQKQTILEDAVSLAELARRPYFKRLWIIQEVALAIRASVTCGGSTTHWTDLCSALQSCGAAPAWMKHFLAPVYARREAPSVVELLQDTRGALCIDPRDRLFAIIGLANRAERECLPTDYSLSVQQLYTGLAAYWVQKTDDRSFLYLACDQKKTLPGLPSWVPDWTNIETQRSDALIPELLVGSFYKAFPRLFWVHEPEQDNRVCSQPVWVCDSEKRKQSPAGTIIPSVEDFEIVKDFRDRPGVEISFKLPPIANLLWSRPIVQSTTGALALYAIPLFKICRGEIKIHGVASGTSAASWRFHPDSKLFHQTDDFEIFIIPIWDTAAILKKHSAEAFSLHSCITIRLDPLGSFPSEVTAIFYSVLSNIRQHEQNNVERWFCAILGPLLSIDRGSLIPRIMHRIVKRIIAETYHSSDQIGFSSGDFEAMDRMRTTMINAIDPADLNWNPRTSWVFCHPLELHRVPGEILNTLKDFPASRKSINEQISIKEQISTWSSSVAQLRSQLQEQGSFSDAFQDLEANDLFNPIVICRPDKAWEALLMFLHENSSTRVHLSQVVKKAFDLISYATLDENLSWNYNRDMFLICIVSFDLIVRLRSLLADRQFYSRMDLAIRRSIENPKRIVIV